MDQAPIFITLFITMPTLLKNKHLFHWGYASNLKISGEKKLNPLLKISYLFTHIDSV